MSPGSVAAVRRLLLLVAVLVAVDTIALRGADAAAAAFRHGVRAVQGPGGRARRGLRRGSARLRAAGRRRGRAPRGAAGGADRPDADGLASLGFAFVGSFWGLFAARFVQGAGSAFTWAGALAWLLAVAPKERRGELLGTAMGAAVFGALFGPVIGAVAALLGRGVVFTALSGVGGGARRVGAAARGRARRGAVADGAGRGDAQPPLHRGAGADDAARAPVRDPLGARAAPPLRCGLGRGRDRRRLARRRGAGVDRGAAVGRLVDRRGSMVPVRVSLAAGTVRRSRSRSAAGLCLRAADVVASLAYAMRSTPASRCSRTAPTPSGSPGHGVRPDERAWATGAVRARAGGAIARATGDMVRSCLGDVCAGALARPGAHATGPEPDSGREL